MGIDPKELIYRPLDYFASPGLAPDLQKMKYDKFESLRVDRLKKLSLERNKINQTGTKKVRTQDTLPTLSSPPVSHAVLVPCGETRNMLEERSK